MFSSREHCSLFYVKNRTNFLGCQLLFSKIVKASLYDGKRYNFLKNKREDSVMKRPLWVPSEERKGISNMKRFLDF